MTQNYLHIYLDSIAENGLINHIRDGGTPPNDGYVKAFQQRWKAFAEHPAVEYRGIETVMGEPCHVFKHNGKKVFLLFKANSGESFTGYQLTKKQSMNHDKNSTIGNNYKN